MHDGHFAIRAKERCDLAPGAGIPAIAVNYGQFRG
jgi:hypothetical protein